MAKKPKQARKAPTVQWTLRTDPKLRDWASNQAKELNISRDAFMRLLLTGARKQMQSLEELEQQGLFDEITSKLEKKLESMLDEATRSASLQSVRKIRPTK
jgi:hypothetical protein